MMAWAPRLVALTRASIYTKLLIAFLAIVALMLASGLVGGRVVRGGALDISDRGRVDGCESR